MILRFIAATAVAFAAGGATAKECWVLTDLRGQIAFSAKSYAFEPDRFSNPMVLCFNEDKTGSVTGDDTEFVRFGSSTLIGWTQNKGIELVEAYQIDRANGRVLFTKTRIGTTSVIPGGPDLVGSFVGKAVKLRE